MSLSYDLPTTADTFRCGILSSKLAALFDCNPGPEISEAVRTDVIAGAGLVKKILNVASTETILTLLSRIYDTLHQATVSSVIPEKDELASVVRDFFGFLADAMLSNIGRSRDRISPNS